MNTLLDDQDASSVMALTSSLQVVLESSQPVRVGNQEDFAYDSEDGGKKKEKRKVEGLKEKFGGMKIVSRAKVTKERVYCAAYHPEVTKDLIFFGGTLTSTLPIVAVFISTLTILILIHRQERFTGNMGRPSTGRRP